MIKTTTSTWSYSYVFYVAFSLIVACYSSLLPGPPSQALSEAPQYAEVEFSSMTGEIFVNPKYTGSITNVRRLFNYTPSSSSPGAELEVTSNGWESVTVPAYESGLAGLIVTGEKGTLKISFSTSQAPMEVEKVQPLTGLIIRFGQLSATLLTPSTVTSKPGGFAIDILDHKENKFISGDIIAIKDNQVAAQFEGLPPTVVNSNGTVRISLKESGDKFLNADLKAWGYNVFAPDADVEKPSPIKAEVFGLPGEAKLSFNFQSLPGQKITPPTRTLTVGEINSGEPIVTIITSRPGAQPLSVSVEKVN
jgi:hypothetical protein